jgi:hypothetical protein
VRVRLGYFFSPPTTIEVDAGSTVYLRADLDKSARGLAGVAKTFLTPWSSLSLERTRTAPRPAAVNRLGQAVQPVKNLRPLVLAMQVIGLLALIVGTEAKVLALDAIGAALFLAAIVLGFRMAVQAKRASRPTSNR